MIAYFDSSALVKLYLAERGSKETSDFAASAEILGTSLISRAEVAAGLAKALRAGLSDADSAHRAKVAFASNWPDFAKVPVSDALVLRAESLAWDYVLRGYDAVHLASALTWRESIGTAVTIATFDRQLWRGSQKAGLRAWPDELP